MDQSKQPFPVSISVCPRTSDVTNSPASGLGPRGQAGSHHIQAGAPPVDGKVPTSSAAPTMLATSLDYATGGRPAFIHMPPSMTAVDNMLKSLNDQDQASSDLEVQSVMCPGKQIKYPQVFSMLQLLMVYLMQLSKAELDMGIRH